MNNVLNEASISYRPWNNLSMQEKAAMIRVAVKNGLTDLKSIREKYNEFAGGGSKRRQESISNAATQQAMKYFMGKGLTDYQAAGLVGNLFRESRLIPTATNAGSGAYGIAQWLGDRKKNLFAKYGKNPTLNQQLDYVWHELGNTHRMGLKTIKSSKNAEEAARNAMGYYEFSAGPEAAIREMRKWGQDGEGAMQKGINFASQLIGGPVVPFRAETPQWNNIPFTPANPEVFFGNPVTTNQPVVDMEPTKTPMLEYDPKEAKRQEKKDNLNRFNMFLGMLNGSNESTFPFSMFAEGGKIHISPSKKGTFTAAASRHNMGVQEFASKVLANKDDYSSAMVRKANFARNASRWKHGLGGNLFEDGGPKKPLTRDDLRRMLLNRRAEAETAYNGSVTETQIIPNDNAWVDKPLTRRKKNPHSSRRAEEGAKAHAAWEREHPNLAAWGNLAGAIPFAVAAAPLGAGIVAGGDALAATTAGQAITSGLAPLYQAATGTTIAGAPALAWADAGLQSMMAGHGLSEAANGTFTPMTALELTPLSPAVIRAPGIISNLRPQQMRNHLYVAKSPIGYSGITDAAERWLRGIASGKKADIDNPWWFNSNNARVLQDYAYIPDAVQGAEREHYLQQFGEHALKARADAWRMHNLIPQKYNTFTPNPRHPGSFTDIEGIRRLKYIPPQTGGTPQIDFVNSVGGNVGVPEITNLGNGIPDVGTQIKRFGVTTTSDWFDLQPFSRANDRVISRMQEWWGKHIARPLDKIGMYPWQDNFTYKAPSFKFLKPLEDKMIKLEVGDITGGKPFLVQYDIPWTTNIRFTSEAPGVLTEQVPGFVSENLLPQGVFDWKRGVSTEPTNINFDNNLDYLHTASTKR